VSEQILWDHSLSWEEIQDGVVDGGDDGGIDSIFAFLNDKLLVDEDHGGSIRNRTHFAVYILQTKTSVGFSEVAVDKLRTSLRELFNLDYSLDDARSIYNDAVITKFCQIRQALWVPKMPSARCDLQLPWPLRGRRSRAREDHPPCFCDCSTSPSPA
jgi:hypothetical protein